MNKHRTYGLAASYSHPDMNRARLICKAILRELEYANLRDDMARFGLCDPIHPERKKRLVEKAMRASCLIPGGGRL